MATKFFAFRSFQLMSAVLLSFGINSANAQTVQSGIPEKDFGTLGVNAGSPASAALQFQVANASSAPRFVLHYGLDFTIGSLNCSGTGAITCSVQINFTPQSAGLRQDALLVESASGSLLYTTLLHGVGVGTSALLLPGTINTVAGIPGMWGYLGDGNLASNANFSNQQNIAIDAQGNLYIADSINQVVRAVNATTHVIKTVAGTPCKPGFSGDGGLATSAKLNSPSSVALDGAGNLYVADYGNNRVRRVDVVTGNISTVAGGGSQRTGGDGLGDGGPATNALLNGPSDIAIDASGNLFIADSLNALVRKVDRATQIITIYAGVTAGNAGASGNGVQATSASLKYPVGIALSSSGNLYIADKVGNVIRQVNSSNGTITTVAGSGSWGFYGDNGPAVSADFEGPVAVRVDAAGNLYVVDSANNAVREVSAVTQTIRTLAGNGSSGYGGDGGNPLSATLSNPAGIAIDPAGNIVISDSGNNIVRRVSSTQQISFPSTVIGLASPAQLLTLLNTGNQPLNLNGLSIAPGFSQQSTNGNDCSATSTLAAGATCQIALVFVPVSAANVTGQLTVSSTSLSAPLKVSLSGTGTGTPGGQVVLNPASLSFGNQNLNTTSATQVVTLTNKTTGALAISNIWLAGPNSADYNLSTTCTATVPAGASCLLTVSFTPSGVGSRTASVVFNDTAANSPQTVSLAGIGVGAPKLTVSSSTLTFTSQGLSAAPAIQTLSLTNTGSAALSVNSISISGSNPGDFIQASSCSSVAVGAACSVSVWFAPTAVGTRAANLSISSSASSSAQIVALSGTASANSQNYKFMPANGNFETGSLSGWNVIGNGTVVSTSHSGGYGLKTQAGSGTTMVFQDVNGLVPGQSYLISVWVMSSTASASNAELWVHDTTGQNIAGTYYSGSGWQQVSVVFTATATSTVRIHLCVFAGASTIYWDDLTIALAIGNGGFEKGSLFPWNAIGSTAISPQAHSGSYGLMEQVANGTALGFQDIQGLIPGQSYAISAWVKSSNTTTNGAELWLHDTTGAGMSGTPVYPGTGWQQVTTLFKATSTGAVRIHLYGFAGPETLYWDDVTITPAAGNGDFESGSTAPWLATGAASLTSASHAGAFSLMEQAGTGTNFVFQDVQGLVAGQTYVISAWVKASAAANAAELWLHDTTGQNVAGAVIYPGTAWQRVNTLFTATSTGAVRMHLVAFAGTGFVTWDDITISGQ